LWSAASADGAAVGVVALGTSEAATAGDGVTALEEGGPALADPADPQAEVMSAISAVTVNAGRIRRSAVVFIVSSFPATLVDCPVGVVGPPGESWSPELANSSPTRSFGRVRLGDSGCASLTAWDSNVFSAPTRTRAWRSR
jgi:hypothetical protein